MERVTKVLLIITLFLVVFSSDVEGGRSIKSKDEKVDQPETFFGSFPGSFPSPGGLSGSFPSPGGLSGSFPSPGLSGSFPSPGLSGSFPSPGSFSFSPPGRFCSFPGLCVPAQPTAPGGPVHAP